MSIVRASRSGSGGGGSSTSNAVSFLSDSLYTEASPSTPPVGGAFFAVIDTMSSMTTEHGVSSYTTGDGITGLTEGSYCEIETSCIIDNITSMVTIYFELITAEDIFTARDTSYERAQVVLNKVDANSPGLTKFRFLVTEDMATKGVRVVIGGHRGSAGTTVHSFKHTIKEYL